MVDTILQISIRSYSRTPSNNCQAQTDCPIFYSDWIHDKYEDDPQGASELLCTPNSATDSLQARRPTRGPRTATARTDRYSPEADLYATFDPSNLKA